MTKKAAVKIDKKRLDKALQVAPRLTIRKLKDAMNEAGRAFIEDVVTKSFTGYKPGLNRTKTKLRNRSGKLRRSAQWNKTRVKGGLFAKTKTLTMRATIGDSFTSQYVNIQEYGGTVRPKRARNLAIPLPANLTPAGRVRFLTRDEGVKFMLNPKTGKMFLYRDGSDGKPVLLYVLKKEVKVPARLGFQARWRSPGVQKRNVRLVNRAVRSALKESKLT